MSGWIDSPAFADEGLLFFDVLDVVLIPEDL